MYLESERDDQTTVAADPSATLLKEKRKKIEKSAPVLT
tara:strand:- start:191 stop:304 length:114 start_codon:yes stop_codon:yes gene_type:complete